MQTIPFNEAPESVQKTIREQLGDAEPQQVQRVIADDKTFFVTGAGPGGPQAPRISVDNTGNLVGPAAQKPAMPKTERPEQDN